MPGRKSQPVHFPARGFRFRKVLVNWESGIMVIGVCEEEGEVSRLAFCSGHSKDNILELLYGVR